MPNGGCWTTAWSCEEVPSVIAASSDSSAYCYCYCCWSIFARRERGKEREKERDRERESQRGGEREAGRRNCRGRKHRERGWQRWWCPLPRWVVVVRRDTVVERRHTKDTAVRRKRVVMGRESRGVLLLVALAVLAAADAFSTDSKFSHFRSDRSDREAHFRSERGARGWEKRGRVWLPKPLARIHPAASVLGGGPPRTASCSSLAAFLDNIRDISTNLSVMTRLASAPRCPSTLPGGASMRVSRILTLLSFSRAHYLSRVIGRRYREETIDLFTIAVVYVSLLIVNVNVVSCCWLLMWHAWQRLMALWNRIYYYFERERRDFLRSL